MPLSRDHHIVSEFYLKRFADERRQIRRLSRSDRAGKIVATRRATVERDFYIMRDAEGQEHDRWEKDVFGRSLENHAAPVIRQIARGRWPLNDRQRERLVEWIAAQYLRTPTFRSFLDRNLDEWREGVEEGGQPAIRAALRGPGTSDEDAVRLWGRATELYPPGESQSTNTHFRWFAGLLPETARAFYERSWTLARFTEPALLTADIPVVPVDDGGTLHPLAPGAEVVFMPLDRINLLMMSKSSDHRDREISGTQELAAMSNALTVHHSQEYVYSHPEDHFAEGLWDIPE